MAYIVSIRTRVKRETFLQTLLGFDQSGFDPHPREAGDTRRFKL